MDELKMREFANMLKGFSNPPCDFEIGVLESALSENTVQTINRIGSMLEDILDTPIEYIRKPKN
jgi:hypothetical protein